MISHLCFRKRVAPNGGKFKAPLHPFSNYLCLAYFGLVLVLMTRIDDFRAGASASHLVDRAGRSGADTRADQPAKCRAERACAQQQSASRCTRPHDPDPEYAQERRIST